MASYRVHVWSGHFDFLLLFVDFSWPILKSSSGGLHSSSRRSDATRPRPAAAGPSFGEGSSCGSHPAAAAERTTPLPGAQAAAAEPRTHLSLQQQHGEGCGERLAGHPFPTTHGLPWPAQSCSRTRGRRVLFGPRPIPPHFGQCEQKTTDDLSPSPLLKAAPGLSAALWSRWAAHPHRIPSPPALGATARARLWSWRQGSVMGPVQTVFPPCSAGDGRASLGQAVSFFLRVCTSASITSMLLKHF